jgi:hypothetical protein
LGFGDNNISENNMKDCHHFDWGPCDGGNVFISTAYLSRFSGPVSEISDPYVDVDAACPNGLSPLAYVSDARFLPNDAAAIKQAVLNYGALYTTYYHDNAYYNASSRIYYCTDNSKYPNHAVTLVGWDDNKQITSTLKGAWIMKNSWGAGWGENGYFYIAYADATVLSENAYFPVKQDYKPSSKLYFYDDLGWTRDWGYNTETAYGLVKFIASDNNPLTKVGTYINTSNATIDISIYDTFNGTTLSTRLSSLTGKNCIYPGYYTFDLPSPVAMASGNDFYVEVKYYTPGNTEPLPVEENLTGYATTSIQTGKCWASPNGSTWERIGSDVYRKRFDLCIRAYSSSDCIPPPASVSASGSTVFCQGQSVLLSANSGTAYKYQWQNYGMNIDNATNIKYNAMSTGEYSVIVTDSKGCSKISDAVNITVISADAGEDININCKDSIKLSPVISYPTGFFVKIYEPVSVKYSNIGLASFGEKVNTSFVKANVLYAKDNDGSYLGCSAKGFPAGIFKNKIALIDRGSCYYINKVLSAQNAGAIAVIIVNNLKGGIVENINASSNGDKATIPVLMISYEDGAFIKKLIADSGYAKASIGYDAEVLKFKWTPSGGLSATDVFKPFAKPLLKTTYHLTATADNCIISDSVTVNILNAPEINLGKDTAISKGQSIVLNPGSGYKSYMWSDKSTNQTLTLNTASLSPGTYNFSVTVTDLNTCMGRDDINITVFSSAKYSVSGKVLYDNKPETPIPAAIVYIKDIENKIIDFKITDANGTFKFDSIPNGYYRLFAITNVKWGGGDPADALLINTFYLNLYTFKDALLKRAADISSDNIINPLDALLVNRRYVHELTGFKAGDWLSENISIIVNNGNLQQFIRMVCVGDVNGSYIPAK